MPLLIHKGFFFSFWLKLTKLVLNISDHYSYQFTNNCILYFSNHFNCSPLLDLHARCVGDDRGRLSSKALDQCWRSSLAGPFVVICILFCTKFINFILCYSYNICWWNRKNVTNKKEEVLKKSEIALLIERGEMWYLLLLDLKTVNVFYIFKRYNLFDISSKHIRKTDQNCVCCAL